MRLIIILILISVSSLSLAQVGKQEYLLAVMDSVTSTIGFKGTKGEMIIPFGRYTYSFSDTLRSFAIVIRKDRPGFYGIDKVDRQLFEVFPFDNGPDYPSEGFFRIVRDGKIGYADLSGRIVIKPRFICAEPFQSGRAKVSVDCLTVSNGEHSTWTGKWFYIDKRGNVL